MREEELRPLTTGTRPGRAKATAEADDAGTRPPGREWLWFGVIVALLLVPLIASALDSWLSVGSSYFPHADHALIEMRTRDVWHDLVTTGPYSRYGMQHPGPLLFYVLAIPYRLLGSRSIGLNVTAVLVNGATVVAILALAMRRGRLPLAMAVSVPLALLLHALGPDQLRDPWNAYLPVLPLLLLLLLAWSVAVGDVWMLPIAVAVGSFAAQTHLGFSLEVVSLLIVGAIAAVLHAYRNRATGALRRLVWAVAVSLGVGIVLWFPVLYGTFVRHDGNLRATIDFFTSGEPAAGFDAALRVLAPQWGFRPEWIAGARDPAQALGTPWVGAFGLALIAMAVGIAWWRRSADLAWLIAVLGVGSVAAVFSVSNIVGGFADYLVRWTWILGAGLGIVVLWAIWLALPARSRATALRRALPAVVVVVALLSIASLRDALREPPPQEVLQPGVHALSRTVLAALPRRPGPVLVDAPTEFFEVPALALQLERHGIPVRVHPRSAFAYAYGPHRIGTPRDARAVLTIVPARASRPLPGREIAHTDVELSLRYRQGLRRQLRTALASPASPARDAMVEQLQRRLNEPARLVTVYLSEPTRS